MSTNLLLEACRLELETAERTTREVWKMTRDMVTELRRQTDAEGWRGLHKMAKLEHSRMDPNQTRVMLDAVRREHINDAQWEWIKNVLILDTLSNKIESIANSARDYLAGPQTVDGIWEITAEITAAKVAAAQMAALRARL